MKKGLFTIVLCLSYFVTWAQTETMQFWAGRFLNTTESDSAKYTYNQFFKDSLRVLLDGATSITFDFSEFNSISVHQSEDKKWAVMTWFLLTSKGYEPQGMFWGKPARKKEGKLTDLQDVAETAKGMAYKTLTGGDWYGALYYQMVPFKVKNQTAYALLGFDGQDGLIHKKIIDVLVLQANGEPRFGMPVFMDDKKMVSRVIFQYSAKAKMSLRYQGKQFVFDHLSPERNGLEGQYQYYVPDFSYDAYRFEKGKWMYIKDVDARNEGENLGKPGEMMSNPLDKNSKPKK